MRLALARRATLDRPDVERGMRPGRWRQILDDPGDAVVAFDQQHVAGPQRRAQPVGIARRERLVAAQRLFQIACDHTAEPVEHPAHGGPVPSSRRSGWVTGCEISRFNLWRTRCFLVHAESGGNWTMAAVCRGEPVQASSGRRNLPETMPALSRRSFLAASAAVAARPALGAPAPSPDVDVVIVGAGAAGIAAARRIAPSGRRFALLEASDRVGGRCVTDMRTFAVPYARRAHSIPLPELNRSASLAPTTRLDVSPAPPG